jgi:hypothetical protein
VAGAWTPYLCFPYLDENGRIRCDRCDRKSGQPPIGVEEGDDEE